MRSRIFAVAFVVVTAAGVASCRRAPAELVQVDAAPPSPPTPSPSSSDTADTAAAADAGEADGGIKATLHAFCAGAFSADADRMRDKCSLADFTLNAYRLIAAFSAHGDARHIGGPDSRNDNMVA